MKKVQLPKIGMCLNTSVKNVIEPPNKNNKNDEIIKTNENEQEIAKKQFKTAKEGKGF